MAEPRVLALPGRSWASPFALAATSLLLALLTSVLTACGGAFGGGGPSAPRNLSPNQEATRAYYIKQADAWMAKAREAMGRGDWRAAAAVVQVDPAGDGKNSTRFVAPDIEWKVAQTKHELAAQVRDNARKLAEDGRPYLASQMLGAFRAHVDPSQQAATDAELKDYSGRVRKRCAERAAQPPAGKPGLYAVLLGCALEPRLHRRETRMASDQPRIAPVLAARAKATASASTAVRVRGDAALAKAIAAGPWPKGVRLAEGTEAAAIEVEVGVGAVKVERGTSAAEESVEVVTGKREQPNPRYVQLQRDIAKAEAETAKIRNDISRTTSQWDRTVWSQNLRSKEEWLQRYRSELGRTKPTVMGEVKETKKFPATQHWAEAKGEVTVKLVVRGQASEAKEVFLHSAADVAHPAVPALGVGARAARLPADAVVTAGWYQRVGEALRARTAAQAGDPGAGISARINALKDDREGRAEAVLVLALLGLRPVDRLIHEVEEVFDVPGDGGPAARL